MSGDETDVRIAKMRFNGETYEAIAKEVGLSVSWTWERLRPGKPAAAILERLLAAEVETAVQQVRRHTAAAVRTLAEIQADPDAPQAARIAAARELLARGGVAEASEVKQTIEAVVKISPRDAIREALVLTSDADLGLTPDDD